MKEVYRISKHGAEILINVPHPRHDNFLGDPTQVRPVTPAVLGLFDKELNDCHISKGESNTPLAHFLGVDFKITAIETIVDEPYRTQLAEGKISWEEFERISNELNNVISDYRLKLKVLKP